jgi:hypothetical protein
LFFAPGYCSSWPFGRFPITCHWSITVVNC